MPYVPPDYSRMEDIVLRGADAQAERTRQSGQIWGDVVNQIGQAVGQAVQVHQIAKQDAALTALLRNKPEADFTEIQRIVGPQRAKAIFEGMEAKRRLDLVASQQVAMDQDRARDDLDKVAIGYLQAGPGARRMSYPALIDTAIRAGMIDPQTPRQWTPDGDATISDYVSARQKARADEKKQPLMNLGDGTVFDPNTQQDVRTGAGKRYPVTTVDPKTGRPLQRLATEEEMVAGVQAYREPKQDNEPLVAIMGPNGEPVLVPRSQAVGKRPASNREQGRPVTSGDADKLGEIQNSEQEVAVLRDALKGNQATGVTARAGAALPDFVTEWTGAGSDAKKKQALIDRVKQVIGKALEGGVLRKEDEAKYEKILPTLGNPPDVVAAKLDGLEQALQRKRVNTLDSLSDAGYDVGRYQQRDAAKSPAPAADGGGIITTPDGKRWKKVGGRMVEQK